MHILLIDDEVNATANLTLYLRRSGHTCATLRRVSSEEQLRGYLEEIQPECVILDFGMTPSGDDVYRWIKKYRPNARIIFYTNYKESAPQQQRMLKCASEDEIIEKREVGSDITKILAVMA